MTDESDSLFLTIPEAAKLLRVERRTLDNLRWQDDGPPFRRHGGRIVYHRDELLAWSEQRRARTPSPQQRQEPPVPHSHDDRPPRPRHCVPESQRPATSLEHQP